jgi:hypothetical protein
MNINYKNILNIKSCEDINKYLPKNEKYINKKDYIFHYLVIIGNIDALKLKKIPVYIENKDGLNCFHLAAKESQINILYYLIDTYPEYIYNKNNKKHTFIYYLKLKYIISLMIKYPNLLWYNLIIDNRYKLLNKILLNISYDNLIHFLKILKLKVTSNNQYIYIILKNNIITTEQKIEILKLFSFEDLNMKDINGVGIIMISIYINNNIIFDYLIKCNVDINYYTLINTNSPLQLGLTTDIIHNTNYYTSKLLDILKKQNSLFYQDVNKYSNNILHILLYSRINRNEQKKNISELDKEILDYGDINAWHQININKETPLEILVNLDYNSYSDILIKNNILINKNIVKKIKNNKNIDKKWKKLYKKLKNKNENTKDNINMDLYPYSHYTLFKASFKDIAFFFLYLLKKYKNIFIPNMKFYTLDNLIFENGLPFSDNLIVKKPIFPWIITYYSKNEYYIHPYLNIIINKYKKKKRFGIVFISLINDYYLHANILIYDFKNMTIERFEPYGNYNSDDYLLDVILEEELTWNTGLSYKKPKDYLPYTGFQTISDEINIINKKVGDFGGYCLAWCIWYIETKIKNPNIDSKILVSKLISKLNNLDIKYSEYIRNYSNILNKARIYYMKLIGIKFNQISNIYLPNNINNLIIKFIINKFINGIN